MLRSSVVVACVTFLAFSVAPVASSPSPDCSGCVNSDSPEGTDIDSSSCGAIGLAPYSGPGTCLGSVVCVDSPCEARFTFSWSLNAPTGIQLCKKSSTGGGWLCGPYVTYTGNDHESEDTYVGCGEKEWRRRSGCGMSVEAWVACSKCQ